MPQAHTHMREVVRCGAPRRHRHGRRQGAVTCSWPPPDECLLSHNDEERPDHFQSPRPFTLSFRFLFISVFPVAKSVLGTWYQQFSCSAQQKWFRLLQRWARPAQRPNVHLQTGSAASTGTAVQGTCTDGLRQGRQFCHCCGQGQLSAAMRVPPQRCTIAWCSVTEEVAVGE